MVPELVIVGDFGKDPDDEHALLCTIGAQQNGEALLSAVVANLVPAEQRARIAQGLLNATGAVAPVGVGTSCNVQGNIRDYEIKVAYMAPHPPVVSGLQVLSEALENAPDQSLTLVLNSGLTDTQELIRTRPDLVRTKLARVAIMGGVQVDGDRVALDVHGRMTPDTAANNMFDPLAAREVYAWLQEEKVPLSILTREAALACTFRFDFYDQLAATKSLIGQSLHDRQQPALNALWAEACAPLGTKERGNLPDRCDRQWFIQTFLAGNDPGEVADIWPLAATSGSFQIYDALNVASVVKPEFFDPQIVPVNGVAHQVIGVSKMAHGIKHERALREWIMAREIGALLLGKS